MRPRGPLMTEHRLIEKVIEITREELEEIRTGKKIDVSLIRDVVDFLGVYADRTHHGKEEDILFSKMDEKDLDDDDKNIMNDLVQDHENSRKATKEISELIDDYSEGNRKTLDKIVERISYLVNLYPGHIEKEDKVFFPNSENYMTDEEMEDMLDQFHEFDRKMIHEKYSNVFRSIKDRHQ